LLFPNPHQNSSTSLLSAPGNIEFIQAASTIFFPLQELQFLNVSASIIVSNTSVLECPLLITSNLIPKKVIFHWVKTKFLAEN